MDFLKKIEKETKRLAEDAKKNINKASNHHRGLGGSKSFRGTGESLGGSQPGIILSVSLPDPGPLGIKVEKRKDSKTAIVAQVVAGTQAAAADLRLGDIICKPGTGGTEEIKYNDFLAIAKLDRRPLIFDVRRIDPIQSVRGGWAGKNPSSSSSSADAYAKRQAVIAAAEARDKAHKKKTKPIPKRAGGVGMGERVKIEAQREEIARRNAAEGIGSDGLSEEARRAISAAKRGEAQHASELGYNPYQASKASAGQARTATTVAAHGELSAGASGSAAPPAAVAAGPGTATPPSAPTSATEEVSVDSKAVSGGFIAPEFHEAFEAVVCHTSDDRRSIQSLTIMRKIIVNATTKEGEKFRRVRLSNPKIKSAIVDTHGSLDLMMSVGFILNENDEDGETYLVLPPGEGGPSWLPDALKRMESYSDAVPGKK